jgi:Raf kinase inhibitor-like YbhB/YbcL family protein
VKGQPRKDKQRNGCGSRLVDLQLPYEEAIMLDTGLLRIAPALALTALASCGASNHATDQSNGGSSVENATLAKLDLTSSAFQDGGPIPAQYTCDGADQTPALSWGEPPQGTKSFALVIDDPHAPSGTFRHWGVYDIPSTGRSLGGTQRIGTEVTNDFGKPGYGGPCPPKGHGPHHYHFKLFALNVHKLDVGAGAKVVDVENAATRHAIGEGELIGTYERR